MLVRIGAVMGYGLEGGASLMEDYSYNFVPGNEFDMGSHMLEVSPSIGTIAKPKLAIYPLGIGGKSDPSVWCLRASRPTPSWSPWPTSANASACSWTRSPSSNRRAP